MPHLLALVMDPRRSRRDLSRGIRIIVAGVVHGSEFLRVGQAPSGRRSQLLSVSGGASSLIQTINTRLHGIAPGEKRCLVSGPPHGNILSF